MQELAFDPADARAAVLAEREKTEKIEKWELEKKRRATPVTIRRDEFDRIKRYDTTIPTGKFYHKIFTRDKNAPYRHEAMWASDSGATGIPDPDTIPELLQIVEMCVGPYGELDGKIYWNVYEVIFSENAPDVIDLDTEGDYGYRYDQFKNRVYTEYATREKDEARK